MRVVRSRREYWAGVHHESGEQLSQSNQLFGDKEDNLHGTVITSWRKGELFKMWIEIILFGFLGICAVWDSMEKKIPLAVVWLGIITAIMLHIQGMTENQSWLAVVLSVVPGVLFWMISFATNEKVGYGDGWLLVMIGVFNGLWKCFLILLVGLAAESLVALVLLAMGRASKNRRIPFAPFLLFGMGVMLCL